MGNVSISKRRQHNQWPENIQSPPMGLQHSEDFYMVSVKHDKITKLQQWPVNHKVKVKVKTLYLDINNFCLA